MLLKKLLLVLSIILLLSLVLSACGYTIQKSTPAPAINIPATPTNTVPATPTNTVSIEQVIRYIMPEGAVTKSTVAYSKYLQQGERVNMSIQLTGEPVSVDWSYTWDIQLLGPGGESMEQWQGHWMNSNSHVLNFTASYAGTYTVRIGHLSSYSKNLVITVLPAGWGYSGK